MTTDTQDNEGRTPLHLAALKGDSETVKVLISAGADIHALNEEGATPLHLAAESGHSEVVRILIEAGADGSARVSNYSGVTDTMRQPPEPTKSAEGLRTTDRQCSDCGAWNRWQANLCTVCKSSLGEVVRPPSEWSKLVERSKKVFLGDFNKADSEDEEVEKERIPIITLSILLAIVAIVILMQFSGGTRNPETLVDFGAMYMPLIAEGEYWRLFTAMFVHIGWMHLLRNSIALFIYGIYAEGAYGQVRFILLYIISGLTGSVASYLFNDANTIAAGASGAVFGLLGALIVFSLKNWNAYDRDGNAVMVARYDQGHEVGVEQAPGIGREMLGGLALVAIINLVLGIGPGIDAWAHLGGLLGGLAFGCILPRSVSR